MKFLLTSAGISNSSIHKSLVDMMGKPVNEASALFVPTAIYPLPNGGDIARRVIRGSLGDPFCELGWNSLGLLELTALPSIKQERWVPMLMATDALLVGGGDCQYLCYWMRQSGLADLLPSLLQKTVYVGLSAGSMVAASYGTTYGGHTLSPEGERALGFVNIAILPHLDNEMFTENSLANLKKKASTIPVPTYAIDDQTAIKVIDGKIEVVSEGHWSLFDAEQ
jgi:dipeptidase E